MIAVMPALWIAAQPSLSEPPWENGQLCRAGYPTGTPGDYIVSLELSLEVHSYIVHTNRVVTGLAASGIYTQSRTCRLLS